MSRMACSFVTLNCLLAALRARNAFCCSRTLTVSRETEIEFRVIRSPRPRASKLNVSAPIRWLRVLIGGLFVEASLFAVVIPVLKVSGQHALLYVVPVASFAMCFVFGLWVGRRVESRFVLHGMLVGIVATLLYVGMTRAHSEPFAYLLAHGLKVLGGAAGGFLAGHRREAAVRNERNSAATP